MTRLRVLVVCAMGSDGTSFYRGFGPLSVLQKQMPDLDLMFQWTETAPYDHNRLRIADILFIQRPCCPAHMELMIDAKLQGIPTWVEYDDNVFDIPDSNPIKRTYDQNNVAHYAKECLKMADVVTVTNGSLVHAFKHLNDNIVIVPNAFDDWAFLSSKKKYGEGKSEKKTILWRGADGHDHDLLGVVGNIKQHVEKHPDWHWVFFGINPWMLTKDIPKEKYSHVGWTGLLNYFKNLNKLQPDIAIVPLADIPFNHCKSNIAWIEASYANAATLAPNFDTWRNPGVVTYKDRNSFHEEFDNMLSGKYDLKAHAEMSWQHVKDEYLLTDINFTRRSVLRDLCHSITKVKTLL